MTRYKVKVSEKEFDVELVERSTESVSFLVSGEKYSVSIAPVVELKSTNAPLKSHSSAARSGTVSAPMPGVITKVFVKNGDSVKEGERLLALEAMKMENEVVAPRAGIVSELVVKSGQQVEAKEQLLIVT